jgi:hypothetical protein
VAALLGIVLLISFLLPWVAVVGAADFSVQGASTGHRLTLVPLVLLTLASLGLIRFRNSSDLIWGAIILVALCLVLIVFGWIEEHWIEEHRGLEGVRVPEEFWRVDRLPEAES